MSLKTSPNKSSSRFLKWGVLVIVLAAVAAGGYYLSRSKPVPVVLTTVALGNVEASVSNTRAGTVKACRRSKLSAPAGGQISKMLVKKGDRVEAGQVMLELWDEDLHAQEKLALEQFKAAQLRVAEVCSQAEAAQREAERSSELKLKGFITPQQYDQALTNANSRKAACAGARNDIKQAKARIELARSGLERMILRAPFAGIVADISGEVGEYATPSPPGILTLPTIDLIDDSCMYVSAPIDEVDAAKVKIGQYSRITLDALKGQSFEGQVRRIAPYVLEVEKQARTVEVEVEFKKPLKAEKLLVGYSADVEIIYAAHEKVLRIPTQTLLEGKRVLLYEDGKLVDRTVTTGLSNWENTEITSGLKAGDRIVLSLDKPGVKAGVMVVPEAAAAHK